MHTPATSRAALPPIGCNGRGAQASSMSSPVSLVEPSVEEQFRLVHEAGVFDSFDRLPMPDQVDTYLRCIQQFALPVRTASWFYALGRDEALLAHKLRLAAEVGASLHNIMVHWHDAAGQPVSDTEVADFYLRAYDLGMPQGVEPTLELHVNMWSEDPRRVSPVAELVRRRGVPFNFTLDYSHVIFKMGNAQELRICGLTDDVAAGRVELDPRRPGSLVDQWLEMGIVRWMQVRSVAPNGPRNTWSILDPSQPVAAVPTHSIFDYRAGEPGRGILYPFEQPAPGEWHSAWDDAALECTRAVVKKVLAHHARTPGSRLAAITTEMINLPDYAHNARFSLIGQNAAIARHIRQTWSHELATLAAAA
ncbi:MAG: xylose isomerase [Proteobacteria bacterium]|nr:xylose isomerase [Pseudomonadota bacterium]